MAYLIMHPDAEQDLLRIKRLDQWASARIYALLEQLDSDEDLLDRLSQHGFEKDKPHQFNVSRWEEACRNGRYLYRIKVWDPNDHVLPYRIVYARILVEDSEEFHILAIAAREWDYDVESILSKRIFRAYEDIQ
ncbi:hypothetical protein ABZR56_11200 [Pseudomonas aeruginosa]